MKKCMMRLAIILAALSNSLIFPETGGELPELPPPQFDLGSEPRNAGRAPAKEEDAKDLLGELEDLLESPAQKDAKKQLARPEVAIEPIPAIKLDPPAPVEKKAKSVPVPQKVVSKPRPAPPAPQKMASRQPSLPKKSQLAQSKTKKPVVRVSNELQSIDFTKTGNSFVITLMSKSQLKYKMEKELKNSEIIYSFENTATPRNLRRAYDTKEFSAPLAIYTLTQAETKKGPMTKLLLKMREMQVPKMIQSDNKLVLELPLEVQVVAKRGVASELPDIVIGEDAFDGGKNYKGAIIQKLELKDTDVQEAIRLVVRSSGYNVVLNDDVRGTIGSLSLENVPWDQAFHLILQMKKLGFTRRGNLVRVATLETLKSEMEASAKQEDLEPLKTAIIPISYATAQQLSPRATPFLTKRGKIDVDDRTNTLIVRDVESVIAKLQKLFNLLDTQPPAIAISAKFVEVKKSYTRTLGLGTLNMAGQTSGVNFGQAQTPSTGAGFSASGAAGGVINISAPRFAALNANLTIGELEDNVKVLANPTITVQQGQQGSIVQGSTTTVPQAATGLGTVTTPLTQTANLSLNVTPIVSNDGSISLDTNLLQEIPTSPGGGALAKDTRSIKTQIVLQNGDTAVLGGVFSRNDEDVNNGVPFLRKLPFLGYFFSQQQNRFSQNEVLIFITARVLNPESTFKQKS